MRRPSLLASATALLLLLFAAPAVAASPEAGTLVNVELQLEANNGLRAQLETSDKGMVTLELRSRHELVSYEVKGKVTEQGLRARFGRLGLIDVAFTPTRTLSSTAPSEGCTGAPRTLREGTFAGTIDFTGERGFVRIEAPQVNGTMSVIAQWQCPEEPVLTRPAWAAARSSGREADAATMYAFGRDCGCYLTGEVHFRKGGRSIFSAVKLEQHEGMEIVRAIFARAGASALFVDFAAGAATLRPPLPFRGQARLQTRSGRPYLWRSSLRLPFPGAAPVSVQKSNFLISVNRPDSD